MRIKSVSRFAFFLFMVTMMAPAVIKAQPDTYIPGFSPGIPVNGYVVLDNGDTLHGQVSGGLDIRRITFQGYGL